MITVIGAWYHLVPPETAAREHPSGMNFRPDFLNIKEETHDTEDIFGKVSSMPSHRRAAWRLYSPPLSRKSAWRWFSEGTCYLDAHCERKYKKRFIFLLIRERFLYFRSVTSKIPNGHANIEAAPRAAEATRVLLPLICPRSPPPEELHASKQRCSVQSPCDFVKPHSQP